MSDLITLLRKKTPESENATAPFAPTLPGINVLPIAIRESIKLARIRRTGILSAAVVASVSALIWISQIPAINASQVALENAQTANAKQQSQLLALSPISQMLTQITRQEELVNATLAGQPAAMKLYRGVLAAAATTGSPAMKFISLSFTYDGLPSKTPLAHPCPNPDPFAAHVSIGCITFSATAGSREQVSSLLVALGNDSRFVGPYVNTSTLAGPIQGMRQTVNFTGTVGISPRGLVLPPNERQLPASDSATATPAASPAGTLP